MELFDLPEPQYASGELVAYVRYDEELFLSLHEERQQFCYRTWIEKMQPVEGVRFLVLQLIPDPLFPTRGNETPYIHWRHDFDRKGGKPWTVTNLVTVEYENSNMDPRHLSAIMRELGAAHHAGTKYQIVHKDKVFQRGAL